MSLPANTVIAGRYRVIRLLGGGGMGAVYVVEQLTTGKERALKVMHPDHARDAVMASRFAAEIRLGAHIESPHVVEVIDAGVDENQRLPFLVMELLVGEDLETGVLHLGRYTPNQAVPILLQVCDALSAAHAKGIVHRDLKTDNIFLQSPRSDREGDTPHVKVLDFGIAKMLEKNAVNIMTMVAGTPVWMAPEQTQKGTPVDVTADIWPMGLIAYRMLTGKHYWLTANKPRPSLNDLFQEMLVLPMVAPSERARDQGIEDLPAGFDSLFFRCVQRGPQDRAQSAAELANLLAPALLGIAGRVGEVTGVNLRDVTHASSSGRVRVVPTQMATPPHLSTLFEPPVPTTPAFSMPPPSALLPAAVGALDVPALLKRLEASIARGDRDSARWIAAALEQLDVADGQTLVLARELSAEFAVTRPLSAALHLIADTRRDVVLDGLLTAIAEAMFSAARPTLVEKPVAPPDGYRQTVAALAVVVGVPTPDVTGDLALLSAIDTPNASQPLITVRPDPLNARAMAFLSAYALSRYLPNQRARVAFRSSGALKGVVFAACRIADPHFAVDPAFESVVSEVHAAMLKVLSPLSHGVVAKAAAAFLARGTPSPLRRWLWACEAESLRIGLLLCGDLTTALAYAPGPSDIDGALPLAEKHKILLEFAVSEDHIEARQILLGIH